jgi:hypothetical protein
MDRARTAGGPRRVVVGTLLVLGLGLSGCTSGGDRATTSTTPSATTASPAVPSTTPARPVTHKTLWLCKPGMADNPCEDGDLDATVIARDGSRTEEPFTAGTDPMADCFYVYPTVSEAPGRNAPLKVTDAEIRTVRAQAARFAQVCRVFAPMYRQITRKGLVSGGLTDQKARALAYSDVLSAFNDYLNTDNAGRPFVLIGHSQGSWNLTQLIQQQIDGDQVLRQRLLSALLLGGTLTTAPGQPAHGTFLNVPVCRSPEQSGCVVGYSTYAGTPPANGIFGRSTSTQQAMCVNPAALLGRDELSAYLPTAVIMGSAPRLADAPDTGFVTIPGRVSGECRSTQDFTWLDVDVDVSGIPGAPQLPKDADPAWGLHSADVSLALGDLVDLVAAESAAWTQRGGPSQP